MKQYDVNGFFQSKHGGKHPKDSVSDGETFTAIYVTGFASEFSAQQNKELRDEIDGLMDKYRAGLDEYIKLDCEYNKLQSKLAEKEKIIRDRRKQIIRQRVEELLNSPEFKQYLTLNK